MIKASFFRDWGQVDLFYLPYFRERTFPGARRTPSFSVHAIGGCGIHPR